MTSLYNQNQSESYYPSSAPAGRSLLRGALMGGLTLASGLGLGAALMYLLDPDAGQRRRSQILQSASDLASSAASTASDLTGRAADYASDYLQRGRDALPSSLSRVTGMLQEEDEGFSTTTFVLTAIGCCAAGAALMFLLDPSQGRSRRKLIADKTTSGVRRSSEAIGKKARHYGNLAKGLYHETRNRFSSEEEYSEPETQSGGQSNLNPNM